MAKLIHEVWEEVVDGMVLHTCCHAGPLSDGCRQKLSSSARLLTTFEASSHFEAMTIYKQYLSLEPYTTNQPMDYESYPEEWLIERPKNL